MKLLFVHSGAKIKQDNEGNLYIDGAYSKEVFQRYLNLTDKLTVIFRKDKKIYDKEYAKHNFEPFNAKNIKFIEYKDRNTSIKDFFNIRLIMENRKIIKEQVKINDKIIVRLPSPAGYETAKYAKKYKKQYLAEVVGCIWDALWNYGLKGKILAPISFIKMRNSVRMAKYVIYVTEEFLQKRYPNKNINVGCSDVVIPSIDDVDLQDRKEKILKTNANKLSFLTVATIDIKYKGQIYVLKAINELKKRGYKIKYYIVGAGSKEYLDNYAKKLGIQESIEFVGAIPHKDVFEYLEKTDIYIQPSLLEGLSRAIIEAMSKACLIIASNVGGNTELIEDKKCIFKKGNVKQLIRSIEYLSREKMEENAEMNFYNAKNYLKENLEKKRNNILKKYIENN